ncbi:MAG: hypothetical protein M3081_07795, partial [Gemmatimonadota bacterium]|nr:hypothetical protein [Gemmatimonadota bacterium]
MSDHTRERVPLGMGIAAAERLSREVAILAGRLATLLGQTSVAHEDSVAAGVAFLRSVAEPAAGERSLSERIAAGGHEITYPLDRIAGAFELAPVEIDLLLLAGMAEEHEGFASLFRTLHPRSEPRPTAGLATQLICTTARERLVMRELLSTGAAVRSGALVLSDDAPFFERTLTVADSLWAALGGVDLWPSGVRALASTAAMVGLSDWLAGADVARASAALARGTPSLVLVAADDETIAMHRATALARHAGVPAVALATATPARDEQERLVTLHATARGVVPIVRFSVAADGAAADPPLFRDAPGPVIVCVREGAITVRGTRPVITVRAERLSVRARGRSWSEAIPELADAAPTFGARFSLDPHAVVEV